MKNYLFTFFKLNKCILEAASEHCIKPDLTTSPSLPSLTECYIFKHHEKMQIIIDAKIGIKELFGC
jgi:hypothetical protein